MTGTGTLGEQPVQHLLSGTKSNSLNPEYGLGPKPWVPMLLQTPTVGTGVRLRLVASSFPVEGAGGVLS